LEVEILLQVHTSFSWRTIFCRRYQKLNRKA